MAPQLPLPVRVTGASIEEQAAHQITRAQLPVTATGPALPPAPRTPCFSLEPSRDQALPACLGQGMVPAASERGVRHPLVDNYGTTHEGIAL